MDTVLKNIIDTSKEKDFFGNTFTTFIEYCSQFTYSRIVKMFRYYKGDVEERIKYPEWTKKNLFEIEREERYVLLMEKYLTYKEKKGLALNEEEDKELLKLHNVLLDQIHSSKINETRKRYRLELKLAAEFQDQLEKGVIVFESSHMKNILPDTQKWIQYLITFLMNNSQVTEDDLDQYSFVEAKLLIKTIPSMTDAFIAYKRETDLPPMVTSFEKYKNSMRQIMKESDTTISKEKDIIKDKLGINAKIDVLLHSDMIEELGQEILIVLERLEYFSQEKKAGWREKIERGKRKNMERELKELLTIFRNIEQREQISKEERAQLEEDYIAEAKKCQNKITNLATKMREKVENLKRGEELKRAEEIEKRFEK